MQAGCKCLTLWSESARRRLQRVGWMRRHLALDEQRGLGRGILPNDDVPHSPDHAHHHHHYLSQQQQ